MEKNEGYRPVIPNSFLTSLLVLVASLLNLSNRVTTSVLPFFLATPMASVLSISISLPDAIHHLMASRTLQGSTVEWSLSILVGLVHFHPGILKHRTKTGGVSIIAASTKKGSRSIMPLQIDIDVRMCQE